MSRRGTADAVVGLADRQQLPALPGQPAEPHAAIGRREHARLRRRARAPTRAGPPSRRRAGCRRRSPSTRRRRTRARGSGRSTARAARRAPRRRRRVVAPPCGRLPRRRSRPTRRPRPRSGRPRCAASRPSRLRPRAARARTRTEASWSWIHRMPRGALASPDAVADGDYPHMPRTVRRQDGMSPRDRYEALAGAGDITAWRRSHGHHASGRTVSTPSGGSPWCDSGL